MRRAATSTAAMHLDRHMRQAFDVGNPGPVNVRIARILGDDRHNQARMVRTEPLEMQIGHAVAADFKLLAQSAGQPRIGHFIEQHQR